MLTSRSRSIISGSLLLLGLGGLLLAHPDDPKGMIKRVPYQGPGYRSDAPNMHEKRLAGGDAPPIDFPASGIQLQAWLPLGEFDGSPSGNDCWGYVSPSGREYAIMGLRHGTGFVDITVPGNPVVLSVIEGAPSTWRDMKVYSHYAYSVTEGFGGGIQVIDLSRIDSGEVTLINTVQEDINDPMLATGSSHNVALDEDSGFLYRCGGGNNGLRIYSLADPANPTFVGAWSERYVHDAQVVTYTDGPYAERQIVYCCSGFNGGSVQTGLDVLDVTDKDNIINLARLVYTDGRYSHQAWLSTDRNYLYLNDEADETGLGLTTNTIVFDVSDPANPFEASTFTNGSTAIGHNLYVRDNLIYEANYRSGLRVFDATDPLHPVEVAYFDTWPEDDFTTFNGLWSVYPFFPSGTVIGSDIEKGLFVFGFTDCNDNGIPDPDEIDADPSLDCNLNGLIDSCDIADAFSRDDNLDGIPDECTDCNGNDRSDVIDIALGSSFDCNGNGLPDECEPDCNRNGIPDECDLLFFSARSAAFGPIGSGLSASITVPTAPRPVDDAFITVRASADLAGANQSIEVLLNGFRIATVFDESGHACPTEPDEESFTLNINIFAFLQGFDPEGSLNFSFQPSEAVDGAACNGDSFIEMELHYAAEPFNDDNGNGIPDECDPPICQGLEATIYVDLDGLIVGGLFDGRPYFGLLLGTHRDDVIVGTDGSDVILGLKGDDVICAGAGHDLIIGGRGDDTIDAGAGFDFVNGNRGEDTCYNGEHVRNCEHGDSGMPIQINGRRR